MTETVPADSILLDESDLVRVLKLDQQDIFYLLRTRQLAPSVIAGKRCFLTSEVKALVRAYQSVQHRN